jgi:hypothetical protein
MKKTLLFAFLSIAPFFVSSQQLKKLDITSKKWTIILTGWVSLPYYERKIPFGWELGYNYFTPYWNNTEIIMDKGIIWIGDSWQFTPKQ